ncbi:MAG: division/cell wall cluster transcriptional repressor MraZ [Alphaproteobacteria bacterium]|nr:division/cell wall cluster transcriptional repressor MraZ [Alphaproteobacteria bacterium]
MATFLSRYVNKVDRKGRVSVPAPFRIELGEEGFAGIIVRPSFFAAALDGCGKRALEALKQKVSRLDPFSEERLSLANAIFARSYQLPWDSEGRVVLPTDLLAHACIEGQALFAGLGEDFQIWEPSRFSLAEADALRRAPELRHALHGSRPSE